MDEQGCGAGEPRLLGTSVSRSSLCSHLGVRAVQGKKNFFSSMSLFYLIPAVTSVDYDHGLSDIIYCIIMQVVSWIITIWIFGSLLIFVLARVLGGEVHKLLSFESIVYSHSHSCHLL